jgi:outer membrane protein assembly factor BamB
VNKHLLIVLSAIGLAAGCASKGDNSSQYGTPQPLESKSFTRQWATELVGGGNTPVTAIHLSDQFVFAYRQDGTSWVMNRADGRLLHRDAPKDGAQRMHPPVVLADRIVYPTTTYLEVFEATSGRYIEHATKPTDELNKPFSQQFDFPIRSDAVGNGKLMFFGADFPGSGRCIEVDMTHPYVPALWTLMEPGSSVSAAPALIKDILYVASDNGTVAAVATDNREPIWTLEKGVFGTYDGVIANLQADATGVYIASTDTKLYCLQRTGGKVKWQYFAGTALRDSPVLTKDLVYQVVPGAGLAAIDKVEVSTPQKPSYNRMPRWVAGNAVQFCSEDDTYAYVRSSNNQILALDKKTGEQRFASKRDDLTVFGANTKGDGIIYAATSGARVMAVKPVLVPGGVGEIVLVPIGQQPVAMAR